MKGFSNKEFENLIRSLGAFRGQRLQEVGESSSSSFQLNFWSSGNGLQSWCLDLNPRLPLFLPMPSVEKARSGVKKSPLLLFLKAHFEGKTLRDIRWNSDLGRVFQLDFGHEHFIEIRLYSGGANCILSAADKKLSLRRPAELKAMNWVPDSGTDRSLSEIYQEFMNTKKRDDGAKPSKDEEAVFQKKTQKAVFKLKADINDKKEMNWEQLGHWLMENQSLDVPPEWVNKIQNDKSPLENAQDAFQKAKDIRGKIKRAEKRLAELEKALDEGAPAVVRKNQPQSKAKLNMGAKGRSTTLSSGHIFFVGKNAADNLKILRAASSWDYWLHLKDYPAAHAILKRNKKEKVPQNSFYEAGKELVCQHLKKKQVELMGEKFDILVVEVRFVRPIKGDKLGRVNYSNEAVISCQFN